MDWSDRIHAWTNQAVNAVMGSEGMEYNVTLGGLVDGEAVVEMVKHYFQAPGSQHSNQTCPTEFIPPMSDYYQVLSLSTVIAVFTLGSLAVLGVFAMFADTAYHLQRFAPRGTKTSSIFVISIYPVVAVATFCAVVVPRAQLVSEAGIQTMLMACLYQLFCLFIAYCEGETGVINKVNPNTLSLKVGPCCCWPCCCLPPLTLTKERVMFLRIMVLQLPVIQSLAYIIQLVMWAEAQRVYQINNNYIQPIVVVSILIGLWGLLMTLKMVKDVLGEHRLQGKLIVLQLVLLLTKFQGLFGKIAIWAGVFPCKYPMTPIVYANLIYNSVLLWEMVALGAFARVLYKHAIPEIYSTATIPIKKMKKQRVEKITKAEVCSENNNAPTENKY